MSVTVSRLEPGSVPAAIAAAVDRFGDRPAIVDDEQTLSFTELGDLCDRYARAVAARGLGPGDNVAVWAPNSAQWVAAVLGALRAGVCVTLLSTRLKGGEASYALRAGESRLLLTVTDCVGLDLGAMLRESDPELDLSTVRIDDTDALTAFLAEGDGVGAGEIAARVAELGPEDTAFLLFTSGTTGRPKGAMVPHRAGVVSARQERETFGLAAGDRSYVVLPMFHVFGLTIVLAGLTCGATTITTSGAFDPAGFVDLLERERISFLPGPPPIFDALLAHPDRPGADLSALRCAFVASTAIPGVLLRRLHGELGVPDVVTGYGLTEGIIVSMSRRGDDIETTASHAGRVLEDVEVRVVDESGADLEAGEPGEFWVRTPSTTTGYYGDPDGTAAALTPDGWLRTGDIGTVTSDGYLRVTDRKKDMFIVGGFNAYPAEIEAILCEHPGVGQAAVIGVPDERMGEVGAAFVVRADPALEADELVAWAKDQMANYKVPRYVELVDDLPMTASMKVAKFVLRDRYAATTSEARRA